MKRFDAFTDEQAHQLMVARLHDVRRIIVVVALLVFGFAAGFGLGLREVSQASDRADQAAKAVAALNKQRSSEAKAQAHNASVQAYAACRRQQEQQAVTRELYAYLGTLADSPERIAVYHQLHHDVQARGLLDIPKCQKPPKGT